MKKSTKYMLWGIAIGAIINGILNMLRQQSEDPDAPLDWSRIGEAATKGGAVVGTAGFITGSYADYENSLESPLNTDKILSEVINGMALKTYDKTYLALCTKADWLVRSIQREFDPLLNGEPFRFGSTEDGTAIKGKNDIDVSVSFKPGSFRSVAEMYDRLESHVNKFMEKNGVTEIRRQRVSIGVFFDLPDGRTGKVDLVPNKITKSRGNKTSGYLHTNVKGFFATPGYKKTDTVLLSEDQLSDTQKAILRALKGWKEKEAVPISSYLLKNLVLDAYACNVHRIPRGLTKKIVMVLSHIKDHIESIRLSSIENSNNILTDIAAADKSAIRDACKKVIDDFEYQPNNILKYFS
jgi:hypothetical protein